MKKILLPLIFFPIMNIAQAEIMFDLTSGYSSKTTEGTARMVMENHLLVGKSVGAKEQFYGGINFTMTNDDSAGGAETTEVGARINYYFNSSSLCWPIALTSLSKAQLVHQTTLVPLLYSQVLVMN